MQMPESTFRTAFPKMQSGKRVYHVAASKPKPKQCSGIGALAAYRVEARKYS